jgi:transposase-like protein
MNPFFSAIIYAALHKRITCSHCGSLDHHKSISHDRFLCKNCNKEFLSNPVTLSRR